MKNYSNEKQTENLNVKRFLFCLVDIWRLFYLLGWYLLWLKYLYKNILSKTNVLLYMEFIIFYIRHIL
jgi:hypothetical protein